MSQQLDIVGFFFGFMVVFILAEIYGLHPALAFGLGVIVGTASFILWRFSPLPNDTSPFTSDKGTYWGFKKGGGSE